MNGPRVPTMIAHKFPLCCMSTKFSPFEPDLIACATSENFGVVGNSLTYFLRFNPVTNQCQVIKQFPSPNATFDISWSEKVPDLLVTAGGDGSIRGFRMSQDAPLFQLPTHQKEINSIECSHMVPHFVLTAGNDSMIKVTDIEASKTVVSMPAHRGVAYQAAWHPRNPDLAASCGSDGILQLWNLKQQKPVFSIPAHNNEILS